MHESPCDIHLRRLAAIGRAERFGWCPSFYGATGEHVDDIASGRSQAVLIATGLSFYRMQAPLNEIDS